MVVYRCKEQRGAHKEDIKMTNKDFESLMKKSIIESYIKVMGVEKWNSLTNEQKDSLLHIMVKGFAEPILANR